MGGKGFGKRDGGGGGGLSLTEVGRLVPTGAAAFESDSTTGCCGTSVDRRDSLKTRMVRAVDARLLQRERRSKPARPSTALR